MVLGEKNTSNPYCCLKLGLPLGEGGIKPKDTSEPRNRKGTVLFATSKGENQGYFPKQCLQNNKTGKF